MPSNNYLLVGANFINKGAEAMAKTVQQRLVQANPDARCFIIVTEAQAPVAKAQGFEPLYNPAPGMAEKLLKKGTGLIQRRVLGRQTPFADLTPLGAMDRALPDLALGIDISGFAYHDGRGFQQPLETIKAIEFCRGKGADYVIMPQAWGPFADPATAENTQRMLGLAEAFHIRDRVSRGYMEQLLGKPEGSLPVVPDIAFGMQTPPARLGEELLSGYGFARSADRPLVAISPNMRVYEKTGAGDAGNAYVQALVALARHLMTAHRAQLVLVPNEIMVHDGFPDDRRLCRLLHEAIVGQGTDALLADAADQASDIALIDRYHSAEDIKATIGLADVLVASRFHSLIFALSQGVPSLAISWSHKYRELMDLFGMADFVFEENAIDPEALKRKTDALLGERSAWHSRISDTLVGIRERIEAPLSLLQ